jgi:hypothetical protein
MVTMKLDSTGVDPSKSASGFDAYDGPMATPGVYAAEIRSMRVRVSNAGNHYFNVLFVLSDQKTAERQKFKGYPHFEKITPGDSDFQKDRVGKLLAGICGKVKANVTHDEVTDGGQVTKVGGKDPIGAKFKIVLRRDGEFNGEPQLAIGDLFPWPDDEPFPSKSSADDEEEDEEDSEEEEEEDVEDEGEDEEEDEEEEEQDDAEAEFEARQEELGGMTRAELKSVLKELDDSVKVLKKHTDDDLRTKILDIEWPAEDDEEEEEGDSEEPPF